ncbi:MAG: class I SAM-dependent methyltransferase [Myxococcota bacterium]
MEWLFEAGAGVYGWLTSQHAWRRNYAKLLAHVPRGEGLTLVDLGCGPGVSTFELARARPSATVMGVDLARRMLVEAKARASSSGLPPGRISWIRADATRLPIATASVDALTAHSFLYLIPDRRAALAECHRVLRPDGKLVLMEPNEGPPRLRELLRHSLDPRFLVSMSLWRPASFFHGRFTLQGLAQALEDIGFEAVRVEETLGGLGLVACAQRPRG